MTQIDVYTLWNVISQQWNETEIQFVLCMIQKALEKLSNTFIVLRVFKQTWRRNHHSMNISDIEVLLESGEFWNSTTLEGWIWYTTTKKSNNNKNPRQVWSRWNGARCVKRSVRKKDLYDKVKEPLQGTRYNTRDELICAIGRSIQNINKDGCADGVRCLQNIWQKMVNKRGNYIEGT